MQTVLVFQASSNWVRGRYQRATIFLCSQVLEIAKWNNQYDYLLSLLQQEIDEKFVRSNILPVRKRNNKFRLR